MNAQVIRYKKRPVEIDAMKFDGYNFECIALWAKFYGSDILWEEGSFDNMPTPFKEQIFIQTLEGNMAAKPGDYIIKGIRNEFYPCDGDIFRMTYDEV